MRTQQKHTRLKCGRMLQLLCGLSIGVGISAHAQSPSIWNGGGSNGLWSNPANWGGNVPVPGTSYDLQFGGTTGLASENDFSSGSAFRHITFNLDAGAFTLAGSPITLAGNITNLSANTQTINFSMDSAASRYLATEGNLVLHGPVSGAGGLNLTGPGTVTFTARNTYTGYTYVNGGQLVLAEGGQVNNANNSFIGQSIGHNGAMYVTGGSFTNTQASGTGNFMIGRAGFGALSLTAGAIKANTIYIGWSDGTGTALIDGGSFYCGTGNDYVVLGYGTGTGVLTVKSGLFSHAGANRALSLDNNSFGRGEINVLGGTLDNTGGAISFGLNTALSTVGSGSGVVNINGGTLILNRFIAESQNLTPSEYNSHPYLNFNGGTLIASASTLTSPSLTFSSNFIPARVEIRVNGPFGAFAGGAVIDTAGQDCLVVPPLLAPAGNGVSELKLADGGSGYIGAPYVFITGDGAGATAIANMVDDGTGKGTYKIASITVCNPGVNYTTAGTAFSLIGGAPITPATPDYSTPVITTPNTSGGLTKTGAGTLTLNGINTYTGPTVVNGGCLVLSSASSGGGQITVNDGGAFAVTRNSSVTTLSTPSLTLGGTAGGEIDFILPEGNTSSAVINAGTLTLHGVSTLRVSGAGFTVGSQFPLIKYTTLVGDPASLTNGTVIPPDGALGKLVHNAANRTFDLLITALSENLKWTGTISSGGVGLWDNMTTANWLNNGQSKVFITGANVTLDDSAPGVTSISLSGEIAPSQITANNSTRDYTIAGPGRLVGEGGLTKSGTRTLTIASENTYGGPIVVNGGVLSVTGSVSNSAGLVTVDGGSLSINGPMATGTGPWAGGTTSGARGLINVKTGAKVQLNGSVILGSTAGGEAAVNISGGSVTNNAATHASNFEIGVTGYGGMIMTGGDVKVNTFYVCGGAGVGVASISGGNFFAGNPGTSDYLLVGGVSGGTGSLTVSGGLLNHAAANRLISINNNSDGRGELNVLGGVIDNSGGGIGYGYNSGTGTGTGMVNLNGGSLYLNRFVNAKQGGGTATGNAYLNFNGGTVIASSSTLTTPSLSFSSNFIPARMEVRINGSFGTFPGGAVIDTAGQNCYVESALLAPTGNGVRTLAVADGGSGYLGTPYVSISGDGTGAAAVANMVSDSNGGLKVGSITVVNPGVNYTTAGTFFSFVGGAPAVAATPGAVTTGPNTSGGLTKNGAGILTLAAANDYTGPTTINGGTLRVDGSLSPASAVTVAGGALGGIGVVGGPVTAQAGGTLAPGGAALGTLSINNTLTLAANSTTFMRVDAANGTNDMVQGITSANYGGTLVVSNTAGTLTVGQTFKLFSATARANTFSAIQGGGITWSFDPDTGIATVVSVINTTPVNVTFTLNGNTLTLDWPETHQGWLVQSNSVNVANEHAWFDVPGSDAGHSFQVQVNSSLTNVFYRLKTP